MIEDKIMKRVIIFGVEDSAELAKYYLENDEKYKYDYKIVGFTIDSAYKKIDKFLNYHL